MARINSKPGKIRLILALLAGLLLLSGAAAFVLLRTPNQFASLPAFPIDSYMEGKALWSHEDYKLEGRVDNVMLRSANGETLLLSIQPTGSSLRLPVLIDRKGGKVPVQREQILVLKVGLGQSSQIQCKYYEAK